MEKNRKSEAQQNTKIRMLVSEEEENRFRKEKQKRHGMENRSRILVWMGICAVVVYCLAVILPSNLFAGTRILTLSECLGQIRINISGIFLALGGNGYLSTQYTLFRYIAVALVGAALSVCGAVYQGAFKNALASPTTLGVQSGCVLGGTIYVMFFASFSTETTTAAQVHQELENMNIFERNAQSMAILIGCFAGVTAIVAISRIVGRGKISSIALILCGSVFGSFITGGVELMQYYLLLHDPYGDRTYALRFLMLGTFDRVISLEDLMLVAIPVLLAITAVMLMRSRLNLLVFGEDEARSMGIRVELTRNLMVGIVTFLTAIVISFCGQIGFVGFIIPHLARRFVGPDFRYLVPGSALLGAVCMMTVYYIATVIGYSSNINFVTSLVGGTIFLIMIIRFRNKRYADWA